MPLPSFTRELPHPRPAQSTILLRAITLAVLLVLALPALSATTPAPKQAASESRHGGGQTVKSGGFSYRIEPPPAWVTPMAPTEDDDGRGAALRYTLVDEQMRVDGRDAEFFRHALRVVAAPAGLAPAAQVLADFDPTFQKLAFHRLGIWRDGRYIDKLDPKRITLLHRETRLEYRIYDGQITASTMLDDLRVGDRVEYAYTVRGLNPVFDGKFVYSTWAIALSGPISSYRLRLLSPADRRIAHRIGPDVTVAEESRGGMRETIFHRRRTPQFETDSSRPEDVLLADQIQLSEYADWSAVARWGTHLFAGGTDVATAVRRRAEAIRAVAGTAEQRLERALDFVQNEVRYFGMEMGANSHRPADPGKVIEQRFGDCKDKTTLLIALLRELDIAAVPVLVSSRFHGQVSEALTGPFAFDHVIARVELDGRHYWLDGTRSQQTGPLAGRQAVGFGKGLVLQADTTDLASLPGSGNELRISVDEIFRVTRFADDPALESRISYFGDLAEFVRQMAASQPQAQLEKQFGADYARLYPGIRNTAPLRIEEVADKNAITIVQNFAVPKFWSFPDERVLVAEVGLWNVAQAAKHPDEIARRIPLRIVLPGIHRHNVTVEYPEDVFHSPHTSRFDDGDRNFSYGVSYETLPRRVQVRSELRLPHDSVSIADWPAYSAKLRKLAARFAASISVPAVTLKQADKLTQDLRDAETAVRRGQSKYRPATKVQMTALYRTLSLTAQLESGRLGPSQRAQALRMRGIQFDNLGESTRAAADFEEALKLEPGEAKNHTAAAVNAFALGRDALAGQRADAALALAPAEASPYQLKAYVAYFTGDYTAARTNLDKLLSNPAEAEKSYAAMWLYLATRRLGLDGAAAARRHQPAAPNPAWPYPILQLFVGNGSLEDALRAANDGIQDPSRLCELYFYAAEKALLDGDRRLAREYFRKAVDTGVVEFSEYVMAKRRIDETEIR